MSYDDFCRCSPSEFSRIYESHDLAQRSEWSQTRVLAYSIMLPYLNDKPKIKDFMPFPWEVEPVEEDAWDKEVAGLSDKERFEAAKRKMGAKN